jgi:hypothetical protein
MISLNSPPRKAQTDYFNIATKHESRWANWIYDIQYVKFKKLYLQQ